MNNLKFVIQYLCIQISWRWSSEGVQRWWHQ